MGTVVWLVHALVGGLGGQSAPLLHCTLDLTLQCILGTVVRLVHALAGGLGGQSAPLLHCTAMHFRHSVWLLHALGQPSFFQPCFHVKPSCMCSHVLLSVLRPC